MTNPLLVNRQYVQLNDDVLGYIFSFMCNEFELLESLPDRLISHQVIRHISTTKLLWWSCYVKSTKLLHILVKRGLGFADVETSSEVFQDSCSRKNMKILHFYLFVWKYPLDEIRKNNNHILIKACRCGNVKVIKLLFSYGLNEGDVSANRGDALKIACLVNHKKLVKYFSSLNIRKNTVVEILRWAAECDLIYAINVMHKYFKLTQEDILRALQITSYNSYEHRYLIKFLGIL